MLIVYTRVYYIFFLQELHLNANPMQCEGAQALARFLSSNRPRVLRLNFQRCEIADDGAWSLRNRKIA